MCVSVGVWKSTQAAHGRAKAPQGDVQRVLSSGQTKMDVHTIFRTQSIYGMCVSYLGGADKDGRAYDFSYVYITPNL